MEVIYADVIPTVVTPVILELPEVPSIVTEPVPMVRIPVILASPPTTNSVVAPPTTVLLNVDTPVTDKPLPTCKSPEMVVTPVSTGP
jgi:hypothetical protein